MKIEDSEKNNHSEDQLPVSEQSGVKKITTSIAKGLLNFLKYLGLFLIILYGILWIPWVQVKIGHIFAASMSKAWDTKVTLERVEIRPFTRFKFHEFFIQDHDKDTLIYAKYAEAQAYNIFSMFEKKVDIGKVIVKDAVFKVQRLPKAKFFNIHFLIEFFEGPAEGPRPEKFKFSMGAADLVRGRVHLSDAALGTTAVITCDTAYVSGHKTKGVDMIGKLVWGEKTVVDGAKIDVHVYDPYTEPGMDSSWFEYPYDSTIPYWDVGTEKLIFSNVDFSLKNDRFVRDTSRYLDFTDMHIQDIHLDVDTFRLQREIFTGIVNELRGHEEGGFALKHFHGRTEIGPKKLNFSNFKLITNSSSIGHALCFEYNRYGDFYKFVDDVSWRGTIDSSSYITFRDLSAFGPEILDNDFISANLDKTIHLQGRYRGTVNSFRVRDLNVYLDNKLAIEANISMNDVTHPSATYMDLNIKKSSTNVSDLSRLLPFVQFPKYFFNLGKLSFNGSFTGFFQDFVAYGLLRTGLGVLDSDLKMNIRRGKEAAAYEGGLKMKNFDLGALIKEKSFGKVSLNAKLKGMGLTFETLDARLENAKIDSFTFKDYQYKDVLVDGNFVRKKFTGEILSKDTFMDLYIKGTMDLNNELPLTDVSGFINNIDFQKVQITEESVGLALDTFVINAIGNNVDNMVGSMQFEGIDFYRGKIRSDLNQLLIEASNIPNSDTNKPQVRIINLNSDVANASVWGTYDVVNLVRSIETFFIENHPNLIRELRKNNMAFNALDSMILDPLVFNNFVENKDSVPHQEFDIIIDIKDSKNLTQLIDTNFYYLKGIELTGHYLGDDAYMEIHGKLGGVKIADIGFNDIKIDGQSQGPQFIVSTSVDALDIKDQPFIPNINLFLDAVGDSVAFKVKADAVGEIAKWIDLSGKLEINENLIVLKLDTSSLNFIDEQWIINNENHIKIGKQTLDIKNVELVSANKVISLESTNQNKGAKIKAKNLNLGWFYGLMEPLHNIEIDGLFSGEAMMGNLFSQKDIKANILIDTLIINDDYWGSNSVFKVRAADLNSVFNGTFTHSCSFVDTLFANATFHPETSVSKDSMKNLLSVHANMRGAKAKILEYFLEGQIGNTIGYADAYANIYGNIKGKETVMNITGDGVMKGVETTVEFLQTRYRISDTKVKMDNTGFHIDPRIELLNGDQYFAGGVPVVEVSEPLDTGYIGGSLVHNHLKDFGLDVIAVLNNNLALNTTLKDNTTFYGKVYASGTAAFTGPFEKLKLKVDATTEARTIFNLPIGGPYEITENNLIQFVDKKAIKDTLAVEDLTKVFTGLDIELIAHIRPDATARLIFDEKAGDIIEGGGQSDLRILYSPSGELKMFGTFEVSRGNYLFTYKNLINKPFDVKPGGTIYWGENDGDPYKARLNLEAYYKKAMGVSNLVNAYTVNDLQLSRLASQPCNVELLMDIKGELFSPDINFDIRVTDVDTRLQNPINLALRTIRADNNELNRQVFGIIALQQFLPLENNVDIGSSVISTGISTVSELISQQLTLYINDLLKGVIKDVGFISSLEFDFNFNVRDTDNQTINSRTSNVRVGSDVKFLNDRLTLYAGANLDIAGDNTQITNVDANTNYIGGDFRLEYSLTNDGLLKVKAYNRTESTILGRSTRTGIGFSYKKEFNSLEEWVAEARDKRKMRLKEKFIKQKKRKESEIAELLQEHSREQDPIKKKKLEEKLSSLEAITEQLRKKIEKQDTEMET